MAKYRRRIDGDIWHWCGDCARIGLQKIMLQGIASQHPASYVMNAR